MCHNNQWDKLVNLSENMTCATYYLLYNGSKNYKYSGIDVCDKKYDESQFGCSIVDVNTVKNKSIKNGICSAPSFEDFHPKLAQPWRVLACCKKFIGYKNFNLYDIKKYVDPYKLKTNYVPMEMEEIELYVAAIGDEIGSLNYFASENNYKSDFVIMLRK